MGSHAKVHIDGQNTHLRPLNRNVLQQRKRGISLHRLVGFVHILALQQPQCSSQFIYQK